MPRQRGRGGGSPVQALPSPSCLKPFHITLTEGWLPVSCRPEVGRILTFYDFFALKTGKKRNFILCLANGVIGSWLSSGRAWSHAFPGAHPYVCAHGLGWAFCRKILCGEMSGHLYLSGPIYSLGFYLISLTPPSSLMFSQILGRPCVFLCCVCLANVFQMTLAGFWNKAWASVSILKFFPLEIKVLKDTYYWFLG